MPLFDCPPERREGLEAVKRAVGIQHHYLDGWVYLFYENKKFDFKETVAKLQRRDHMEKTVFANYVMTPSLEQSMRAGIVQYVGRDKVGRPVLYFNTVRDSPRADQRPERQANMDMFLSWAVRCDPANPTATVTWLINQQDASLMRNTDLIFQKDMALRISKFFPGVVAKMYLCNMGSALTFVMKPLLKQLPKAISECIFFYSEGDIRRGKLLEVIDADVLPIAMGGSNNIDHRQNYELFATTIEGYFRRCQCALREGVSIKEMEMMEAFPVDKNGQPRASNETDNRGGSPSPSAPRTAIAAATSEATSVIARTQRIQAAGEETLDMASPVARTPSKIHVDRDDKEAIVVMSSTLRRSHSTRAAELRTRRDAGPLGEDGVGPDDDADKGDDGAQTDSTGAEVTSPNDSYMSIPFPVDEKDNHAGRPGAAGGGGGRRGDGNSHSQQLTFFHSNSQCDLTAAAPAGKEVLELDAQGLPVLHVDTIEVFSFASNLPTMRLSHDRVCELQRCWTVFLCHCVTLLPQLSLLMEALRDDDMLEDEVLQVNERVPLMRRVMHHVLDLFPQTSQPLYYPIFHWLTVGQDRRWNVRTDTVRDRVALDCTSPDNFLLSVQGSSVEYVDECERLLEGDKMRDRILRRVVLSWPAGVSSEALKSSLSTKAHDLWRQVVPSFHKYIEAKVAMCIGEFIDHYGLLASGGRIDTRATWYGTLFSGLVQFRELHRRNWLFYVFPPPFTRSPAEGNGAASATNAAADAAPTMLDMLRAHSDAPATLTTVSEFVLLVERSLQGTREQLGPTSVTKMASHVSVERYMEETGSKVYIPYEAQLTGVKAKELIATEKDKARQLLEAVEQPLREFLFVSAVRFVLERGVDGAESTAGPSTLRRDEVLQRVNVARRQCQDMAESRRSSRRTAVSMAKAAYEVQGTFGSDTAGPGGWPVLPIYGQAEVDGGSPSGTVRPDGYAIALCLLLVEALAHQHVAQQAPLVNESFAFSLDSGFGRYSSPSDSGLDGANAVCRGSGRAEGGATTADQRASAHAVTNDDSDDDAAMRSACSAEPVNLAAFFDAITAMDAAALPLASAKRQLLLR